MDLQLIEPTGLDPVSGSNGRHHAVRRDEEPPLDRPSNGQDLGLRGLLLPESGPPPRIPPYLSFGLFVGAFLVWGVWDNNACQSA